MKKILISAGEASGDFYGAELAKQIKKLDKEATVIGFGGDKMRAAGINVRLDPVKHAVMGYWEALKTLPYHLGLFFRAREIIKKEMPDVLVVIDSPSFHMPLINEARKAGVRKIVYYSTPQVWIWKYKRIYEIKKNVDLCINVLPFEPAIFKKEGIRAEYFGHPTSPFIGKPGNAGKKGETIGIFPGSRINEIEYFFDDTLKACEIIKEARPKAEFVLFKADTITNGMIEKHTKKFPSLKIKTKTGWDIKSRSGLSCAIAKSGTVTLELALLGIPMVVIYRLSGITYLIMKSMAKGVFVSLPNILMKKQVVKEFIQDALVPEDIAAEAVKILSEKKYADKIKRDFSELKKVHGKAADAVKNAAKAVLKEAVI